MEMSSKMTKTSYGKRMPQRTAFSAPTEAVLTRGNAAIAQHLKAAFTLVPISASMRASEQGERLLSTHLFHSYAARTDPMTVRKLVQPLHGGEVVFDPFVGSGTTLVETSLKGAQGIGIDVSEFSVRLARLKATPMKATMRTSLLERAQAITERSLARVRLRKRPRKNWDQALYYEPHIYLELCGLREEIETVRAEDLPLYEALLFIFSSIVIKASKQVAESKMELTSRQIGRGQATRWFLRKAEEFIRLQAAFAEQVPPQTKAPLVRRGDAREIFAREKDFPSESVDVVVTSPPYLGIYNYAEHQLRRHAWLDLDPTWMLEKEMASRRESQKQPLPKLLQEHQSDTNRWIQGMARVLKPGGDLYIIVGDSWISGTLVCGDEPMYQAAERVGLEWIATCSVKRVDADKEQVQEGYFRTEHLIQFKRNG